LLKEDCPWPEEVNNRVRGKDKSAKGYRTLVVATSLREKGTKTQKHSTPKDNKTALKQKRKGDIRYF